jgi:hypothetical protein
LSWRILALILRSGNRTREQQNSTGKGWAADKSRHDAPPNSKENPIPERKFVNILLRTLQEQKGNKKCTPLMLCASLPASLRSAACAQQKIKIPLGAPNQSRRPVPEWH